MFKKAQKQKFHDYLRQYTNLLLAVFQVVVSIILFGNGMDFGASTADGFVDPPIVPATYAFSIWGPIYLATIIYGIYQAGKKQRKNKLLREIGFFTAICFLGTSLWLVLARNDQLWLTFACIVVILISALTAFFDINKKKKLKDQEAYYILIPFSLFAGWLTAATFVNLQAVMSSTGYANWLLPEKVWTVLILLGLGTLATYVINKNRYSVIYGLTILWALIGVMVRNVNPETYNPEITMLTGVVGLFIAGNLYYKRNIALPSKK